MPCDMKINYHSSPCLSKCRQEPLSFCSSHHSYEILDHYCWLFKINFYWNIDALQCCAQNESTTHIPVSPFFWTSFPSGHHRALEFPMIYSMLSLVIHLIRSINGICMLIPISQFLPPTHPHFPPWYAYILYVCASISALQIRSSKIKINEIGSFVEAWVYLRSVIQRESSQKEILYTNAHM